MKGETVIDEETALSALKSLDVDDEGFDRIDRKILDAIVHNFSGGPVGAETLSYFIGEELDTIVDVYEPYLLQKGFIVRTPRGRVATDRTYEHLGVKRNTDTQQTIF